MHEVNLEGIINVTNKFKSEIVIGGAVALNHTSVVIKPLNNKIGEESVNRTPQIEKCSLGEESVIQGLRAVANQKESVPNHLIK